MAGPPPVTQDTLNARAFAASRRQVMLINVAIIVDKRTSIETGQPPRDHPQGGPWAESDALWDAVRVNDKLVLQGEWDRGMWAWRRALASLRLVNLPIRKEV